MNVNSPIPFETSLITFYLNVIESILTIIQNYATAGHSSHSSIILEITGRTRK